MPLACANASFTGPEIDLQRGFDCPHVLENRRIHDANSALTIIGAVGRGRSNSQKIVIAIPIGVRSLQIAIDSLEENLKNLRFNLVRSACRHLGCHRIGRCNISTLHVGVEYQSGKHKEVTIT
jgi:hypothetical protein